MDLDVADGEIDGNISIFMQNEKECLNSLISILKGVKGMLAIIILFVFNHMYPVYP